MMKIHVKLFARARELAGSGQLQLEFPEHACVRDAKVRLSHDFPALQPLMKSLLIAINGDYAADSMPLVDGCELAAFPPVSGG